jgi:hypothetical protein
MRSDAGKSECDDFHSNPVNSPSPVLSFIRPINLIWISTFELRTSAYNH